MSVSNHSLRTTVSMEDQPPPRFCFGCWLTFPDEKAWNANHGDLRFRGHVATHLWIPEPHMSANAEAFLQNPAKLVKLACLTINQLAFCR